MPRKADFSLPHRIVTRLVGALECEAEGLPPRRRPARRFFPPPCMEDLLRRRGFSFVAGVDEAGRGPLAGPVVAAAVVLDPARPVDGIRDSKKLSPQARLRLCREIRDDALAVGVGMVNAEGIDTWNILRATEEAMRRAVHSLGRVPDWVLVDGVRVRHFPYRQIALTGGDRRIPSIAAASIVAKTVRDRLVESYHHIFPLYGFDRHKGYPTREHGRAVLEHGSSPIHRKSFHVPGEEEGERWKEAKSESGGRRSPPAI